MGVPWQWCLPKPPPLVTHECSRQSANATNKQTTHHSIFQITSTLGPNLMPYANTDAPPREDHASGGGGVNPIAVIFWQRPSSLDAGDKSWFEAKEPGRMVVRQKQEGEMQDRKTRKLTDKNGAAKQGHTADEGKKISWFRGRGKHRTLPTGPTETNPVSTGRPIS